MDTIAVIHHAIEWANKRLELQGEKLSENQISYIKFALSQNFTDNTQALQLRQCAVSSSINSLLSKFDNGIELYQNNAVFSNCIEYLLRGGDIYKILEQVIVNQDKQQKRFEDIIKSGAIRQEIIVSK